MIWRGLPSKNLCALVCAAPLLLLAACVPVDSSANPAATSAPTLNAITPVATSLPATPHPEITAALPLATAVTIRFAAWSPDSRWVAFSASTGAEVQSAPPGSPATGTLYFADVTTDAVCAVPSLVAGRDDGRIVWLQSGGVIVQTSDGTLRGEPCRETSFEPFAGTLPEIAPPGDASLSPGGLYRVTTTRVASEQGILTFETTIRPLTGTDVLQQATWQIDERLGDYGLGGEWVSRSQFLIDETLDRGPLILDLRRGMIAVLPELFEQHTIPSILGPAGYSLRAIAYPASEPDTFHLLLAGVGVEASFPPVRLYHAERGLVETLPYTSVWSRPSAANADWVLLDEHPTVEGYERHAVRIRGLDDVGGAWQLLAGAVDTVLWADDGQSLAFSYKGSVTWQTFPLGTLIGRWDTAPYWSWPVAWSPDGRSLLVQGNVPGRDQTALFDLTY